MVGSREGSGVRSVRQCTTLSLISNVTVRLFGFRLPASPWWSQFWSFLIDDVFAAPPMTFSGTRSGLPLCIAYRSIRTIQRLLCRFWCNNETLALVRSLSTRSGENDVNPSRDHSAPHLRAIPHRFLAATTKTNLKLKLDTTHLLPGRCHQQQAGRTLRPL